MELWRLQELLFGKERLRILELEQRLAAQRVDAEAVAKVLPAAVSLGTAENDALGKSLAPTIEGAIRSSVARDPGVIADAIYPVIGPAIRKSIMQAMGELLESINRALEHSLSPKSIGWRFEAMRSGRPFAEIVLKHSLIYRVEQVFLIHRSSSLLLEHLVAPQVGVQDPDMVSAMLGAIQDFVVDAFGDQSPKGIAQVEFGEDVLHVAQGPHAILACLVRGIAPVSLRQKVEIVLEEVHSQNQSKLRDFVDDASAFQGKVPVLRELLLEQKAEKQAARRRGGWRSYIWPVLLVFGLAALSLYYIRRNKEIRRWNLAIEALADQPGLVVIEARRAGAGGVLVGLRDPSAVDPRQLFEAAGVDPLLVETRWTPFQSLEEELVVGRVGLRLEPPKGVALSLFAGELSLEGSATHAWITSALAEARKIQGVDSVDSSKLIDLDLEEARYMAQRLSVFEVEFDAGSHALWDARSAKLNQPLADLVRLAQQLGQRLEIQLTGHVSVSEAAGASLGWRRSEALRDRLSEVLGQAGTITMATPKTDAKRGLVSIEVRLVEKAGGA